MPPLIALKQTDTFHKWRIKLKDENVRKLLADRLSRLSRGHFGDTKSVGQGIYELRIHYGPGYRIYFQKRENDIIILLCGGDKSSQAKDIEMAKRLTIEWSQ